MAKNAEISALAAAECTRIIVTLRENAGLTRRQLADKLGVSHQDVSRMERGGHLKDGISLATLFSIAEVCGAELDLKVIARQLPENCVVLRAKNDEGA